MLWLKELLIQNETFQRGFNLSTTNVVFLPDSMQRQWRLFEQELKEAMQFSGSDANEINYVIEQVKPIYLEYAKPNCFSGDHEKVLEEFNTWVRKQTSGFLNIIIFKEIELYRLRGKANHH